MKIRFYKYILFSLLLSVVVMQFTQCRKDKILSDASAKLSFSTDTLLFDTIFTTLGSTTKLFKIYNTNNQKMIISSIQLAKGTQSMFRINVDGSAGVSFNNIEIEGKDSLFVFVEVTIDPNGGINPMVVEDKVNFVTNGNAQTVVLNAFGQDAYFHVNEIITTNTTWATDKPHVIYNYCAVDSAINLTIPGGGQIHGYKNSVLYIYKGSLNVQGTIGNEVVFKQARTEDFLLSNVDSTAGQWRGIYFLAPKLSQMDFAIIENATIGIQIDTTTSNADSVILQNVRIDNSSFASLVTQGANIYANSCLFGNAASYSAFISLGGSAYFEHCTFANYWNSQRNTAIVVLKDYYEASTNNIQYRPFNKATIKNSIIYGPNDTELVLDTLSRSLTNVAPVFLLDHTLIKYEDPVSNGAYFNSCWKNDDPSFSDANFWDFHSSASAVNNKGGTTNPIMDLDGNARNISGNDLGCYNE